MDRRKMHEIVATIREYENSVEMPARERITYTDPSGGVHLRLGDERAPNYSMYAERCAEYLRYGNEVDAVTCGEFMRTSALKLCDTPALYLEAGFEQKPMLYTQRHMLDALRPKDGYDPHRHGLKVSQIKRLPELLERPVMLCDSPARDDVLLALLCEVDGDRLPLIAAIKPDGHGYYEMREFETNFILAVYGRTDFPRYFDQMITPDRLVYFNIERGRELDALAQLHLLRSHIVDPDLSDVIIRTPRCLVNIEHAGRYAYSDGCDLDCERDDAEQASRSMGTVGRGVPDRTMER